MKKLLAAFALVLSCWSMAAPATQPHRPATVTVGQTTYSIYAGNTHAHTSYTWSHGDQYEKPKLAPGEKKSGIAVDENGAQTASKKQVLKPNWEKFQGPPAAHFAMAKSSGYDFYITTDHSQEADLQPPTADNPKWLAAKKAASDATDGNFVAIAGYEHSENNGPAGSGHLNVINSAEYLNAMAPGVDLPKLYAWLKTAKPNSEGPIVAIFNHPSAKQYADWAYRDDAVTDIITMLEVINSNNKMHYDAFVAALDHGWKVSPVCGNDNHGFWGISHHTSRTFVLATAKTKAAILDGMKNRRTYAALDGNIACSYTVNGAIMGSTLQKPEELEFNITITDPDRDDPKNAITKVDIVKDGGAVVESYTPTPAHTVNWTLKIRDTSSKYFFVRVWNAGGGSAPNADPSKPVAWLAPIWTGR